MASGGFGAALAQPAPPAAAEASAPASAPAALPASPPLTAPATQAATQAAPVEAGATNDPAPPAQAASGASGGAKSTRFEGAIGLVLRYSPDYVGAPDYALKPQLAGFLRYGRLTITGAGGFTTRRQDDVERGLDAELVRRDHLRVNLSLRLDPGRSEGINPRLDGMGDIRPTVRARLGLRWTPAPGWRLGLGTSVDALNRVGGYLVEGSVTREWRLSARSRLIASANLSGAGDRYMQAWYGVTQAQSLASGHPRFAPKEGLREVGAGLTWRTEIGRDWAGFTGASVTRLLGSAADSPLTGRVSGWSLSAGLARRF